jgi:uncharacterized protein YdaU (DUF1376 family)
MSAFDWHPRYHRDALDGMLMLTLEERGAYNTILDLIYDRGGPIPDDPRWLSGWTGVSLRKWEKLRAALIVKGKIQAYTMPDGDVLTNVRAVFEIETQTKKPKRSLTSAQKRQIIEEEGQCAYCGIPYGPFEVDHIHPVSRGGTDLRHNLTCACRGCNRAKGSKMLEEWVQ